MNAQDMNAIAALDLEPIKVKLMHRESGEGWTLERANAVESEYRRFLLLMKKFPNEETAPLVDVDTFWHYHILDTMKYATDCQAVFGYFLHHFPYIGLRGEDDEAAHVRVGLRMKELYEATFGESYARAEGVQAAYSGAVGAVAYSGAVGQRADAANTAYSGAVGQQAGVAAKTAYSGAVGKIAYSGAVGSQPGAKFAANTAYSGAVGAVAYSGAVGAVAYSGAVGQQAGGVSQTAYSGAVGAMPGVVQAQAEAVIEAARQSSFYSARPRLDKAA